MATIPLILIAILITKSSSPIMAKIKYMLIARNLLKNKKPRRKKKQRTKNKS